MRPTVAATISLLIGRNGMGGDTTDIPLPSTAIEILVGTGSYDRVTRDCKGAETSCETVGYREVRVSLTHDISSIRLPAAGGVTTSPGTASRLGVPTYGAPKISGGVGEQGTFTSLPSVAPPVGLNVEGIGMDIGFLFNLGKAPPPPYPSAGDPPAMKTAQ